jgi:hypothetical protein
MPPACSSASRAKTSPSGAGLCRHSIRKWESSSNSVPPATYSHLCRAIDVLECQRGAVSAAMGSTHYAGKHRHQTIKVVLAFINSESIWTWLLGSVTPAYATRAWAGN